jgi:hypothetical protein
MPEVLYVPGLRVNFILEDEGYAMGFVGREVYLYSKRAIPIPVLIADRSERLYRILG